MAISINGVTVAGIGKDGKNGVDGKDATINGANALTIEPTGGLTGQQTGDTYTIDGSGILTSANSYTDSAIQNISSELSRISGELSSLYSTVMGIQSELSNLSYTANEALSKAEEALNRISAMGG